MMIKIKMIIYKGHQLLTQTRLIMLSLDSKQRCRLDKKIRNLRSWKRKGTTRRKTMRKKSRNPQ